MNSDPLLLNFARHHPSDMADLMDTHPTQEIIEVLEALPSQMASSVAVRLASGPLTAVLKTINATTLGSILVAGKNSDVISLVSHMNTERQKEVLTAATEQHKQQLSNIFRTSLKTLSGIVSPDFVRVELTNSCRALREQLANTETQEDQPIFAINEFGEYQGIVSPLALFQKQNTEKLISDILQPVDALSGITPFSTAITAPQWTRYRVLPVTDNASRLLGALTFEQLIKARNNANNAEYGLGELVGEVATGYIDICANLMEMTMGRNNIEPK